MKLIFKHGEKVFNYEEVNKQYIESTTDNMESLFGCSTKFRDLYEEYLKRYSFTHSIYGDDFKIGIIPNNVRNYCALVIKDFDENQKLESEINLDFSKEELEKLINLLEIAKNEM